MARMLVLALLAALALSCGDNKEPAVAVGACVDDPNALLMPPTDQLPCELLPPGFVPE